MTSNDTAKPGRYGFTALLLTAATIFLLLTTGLAGSAPQKTKPLAADLVEDGQIIDLTSPRYQKLFAELQVKEGFSQAELDRLFKDVAILKRPLELMDRQWESKPWHEYYPIFITARNINEGRKKLRIYKSLLDRIEKDLDRKSVV